MTTGSNDTILLYPRLDIAVHECRNAHEYVRTKFPAGSWVFRKTEIVICNRYYIRFESELNENCTRGFRGTIISDNPSNPSWKEVIDGIFNTAIINNDEYPSIKILVICGDHPSYIFEGFADEVSKLFNHYQLSRSNHTVIINGRHKIRFGYTNLFEYDVKEFDDVILTEKSFRKYKDKIVDALQRL